MWLVGMMGSGKTSVGLLVAKSLGLDFFDTDAAVVAMAGRTIGGLWNEMGESGFRELERSAVASAPAGVVAAAGGGAVLDPVNRETMRLHPPVVWLRATPETLASRLEGGPQRPLLERPGSSVDILREILAARSASYEAAATQIVETDDRTLEDVASEVTNLWPG